MPPEARKLLEDMSEAATNIAGFVQGRSLEQYVSDIQFRWSVERGFEIIGEALGQLYKIHPDIATRISDYRKIISFRNVLIHGYSGVNDETTWDIIQRHLPTLRAELTQVLGESGQNVP